MASFSHTECPSKCLLTWSAVCTWWVTLTEHPRTSDRHTHTHRNTSEAVQATDHTSWDAPIAHSGQWSDSTAYITCSLRYTASGAPFCFTKLPVFPSHLSHAACCHLTLTSASWHWHIPRSLRSTYESKILSSVAWDVDTYSVSGNKQGSVMCAAPKVQSKPLATSLRQCVRPLSDAKGKRESLSFHSGRKGGNVWGLLI